MTIFNYDLHLQRILHGASIIALIFGLAVLAASLVKAKLYNKWFAWAGVILFGYYLTGFIISKILLYYYNYSIDSGIDYFLIFGWLFVLIYYKLNIASANFLYPLLHDPEIINAFWLLLLGVFHYRGTSTEKSQLRQTV